MVRKVAEGYRDVSPITFSEGVLWAVANKTIVRIDASGTKTFEMSFPPGLNVAAVGGFVFWNFDDYLLAMDSEGKVTDIADSALDGDSPEDLIVHDGHLYYRGGNGVYAVDVAGIDTKDVSTTAARKTSYVTSLPGRIPHAMAVDTDGTIYWAVGNIRPLEIVKDAKEQITLAAPEGTRIASALVTTPTHVVFADYDHRSVVAVSKDGGEPVTVAENQVDTYQMTADESGVYWVSRDGIMRAELDGSGAHLLTGMDFPTFTGSVAVSPGAIYWTSPGDGAIYEMAK